ARDTRIGLRAPSRTPRRAGGGYPPVESSEVSRLGARHRRVSVPDRRRGFSVLPLSSITLEHPATKERQSMGIPELDEMLEGKGLDKGSTALIGGSAGTGKSSLAAYFADAVCKSGKRCLYFESLVSSRVLQAVVPR